MSELSPAEKKQQLIARVDAIGKFLSKNVSDGIKTFIFGGTNVASYVKKFPSYVSYMNNILSLAFVFAHGCLRCDNDSEDPVSKKAEKQSSLRIINSLRKAYVQYPATSELIQFVLSDIQFEMLNGPEGELYEVFENLCPFRSKDFSLVKYYKVIAQWRAAPSRFSMDLSDLTLMFQKMLQNMTFLKNYDLIQDDEGNFFFQNKEAIDFGEEEKYAVIPVQHHLFYDPQKYLDMYTLFSIEKLEDDAGRKLSLRYVASGGFKTVSFLVCEDEPAESESGASHIEAEADDYYYEIVGEDWNPDSDDEKSAKKNANFIDQVHAINYKYIKNLSLAISDAISVNRGSKKALYNAYHLRHKDVFEKIASAADVETSKLDWDGIIVMLLIESSPTSVLETLFRAVPQTFIAIARNLSKRIDNPDMKIYGKSEQELHELVNEVIREKLIMGEAGGFGRLPRSRSDERLYARAASLLIISSLSAALEEETVEKSICAGNIYDNISLLRKMKADMPADQRAKLVCVILGETFRHLLCFYTGLLSYGEIKSVFDAESSTSCFSEQKIALYQKQLHNAFMGSAKAEADEIKDLNPAEGTSMVTLMKRFVALCESSCSSSSTAGRYLYAAIGKHEILNLGEFKNAVLSFASTYETITEDNVDEWTTFALDILKYLRTGSFKRAADSPFQAIYPFAATYNRGNENYDGYKTVTFTLNIDVDGDDGADSKEYINVLTEFTYNLSDVFYCLPNVLRSNKKWWIDPVLISFKEFNDIFVE